MDYKKYNDYELIYMVRENDEESLGYLFEKYTPIIKKLSNEYYQRYSSYGYDYDDFIQEANIALYDAYRSFKDSMNVLFYTFVVLCIRRRLLSFCRNITNVNKNISNKMTIEIDEFEVIDEGANIDLHINNSLIEKEIHDFILKLPLKYSSVFELRLNGFCYNEIACLLDIPSSTAEYRYRCIKKKFLRELKSFF